MGNLCIHVCATTPYSNPTKEHLTPKHTWILVIIDFLLNWNTARNPYFSRVYDIFVDNYLQKKSTENHWPDAPTNSNLCPKSDEMNFNSSLDVNDLQFRQCFLVLQLDASVENITWSCFMDKTRRFKCFNANVIGIYGILSVCESTRTSIWNNVQYNIRLFLASYSPSIIR